MSKVFIGVGHGGTDPGAVSGSFKEADMNLVMAQACREELERHGVQVLMSRYKNENDALAQEISECNAYNPDLAIDCHNNSGGGDGFEVFYSKVGGTSKVLAQNIEPFVVALGQNSRGCKTKLNSDGRDYFGFIRQTKCPSVICEGAFIDNVKDMQIADTIEEQKAFGRAYAKGILKTLRIAYKEESKPIPPSNNGQMWAVCVGAYKDRANADRVLKEAKEKGFSSAYLIPR